MQQLAKKKSDIKFAKVGSVKFTGRRVHQFECTLLLHFARLFISKLIQCASVNRVLLSETFGSCIHTLPPVLPLSRGG